MNRLSQLTTVLSLASVGFAGLPIPSIIPFSVDGALDSCAPSGSEYNSGGSISVNGFTIEVPKNLIAQFPVAWVPFKKMCDEGGIGGYEVAVSGNVVNGKPTAAQISVGSPFMLEGSIGYIESVDIETASLKIKNGPIVRINDPDGVFSKGLKERELFLADAENPSISSFSGFPMCIPRSENDPLCPSSNRPGTQQIFNAPNPLAMAPFKAGDFIEYSGLKKSDGSILAWEIVAVNVQINTQASDSVPNYIRMEDALIGVFDNAGNVEVADIRFIGYLSSCAGASVSISAIDVDPCTGKETFRQVGTATPRAGDVRCKWEFRADTTAQSTYTREYMVKANNPVITTDNGIEAGQYIIPVTEWIQPEVDVPGTEPPPFRFNNIRGLVEGDFLDGEQFGPLSPFPGPDPPAPQKTCTGPPPDPTDSAVSTAAPTPVATIAPITAAQRIGARIVLDGSQTNDDIPGNNLVYEWTKVSPTSPTVSIQNAASPTATIIAPSVGSETTFEFQLKISLKSDPTVNSTANVTFKVISSALDIVTLDAYTWESRQSGTIGVTCHSNVVNGDVKKMDLKLNNGARTIPMVATAGSPGRFSYSSRSVNRPTNVQCVSGLGGQTELITSTTARRRRGELGLDLTSRADWA